MQNASLAYGVLARFLWKLHRALRSMKNCASTFHALEAAECIMWPKDRTGSKNTSLA
jgi:hypothetical protein